jgi:hypothetical protein
MGHPGEDGGVSPAQIPPPTPEPAAPTGSLYSESDLDRLLDRLEASDWHTTTESQGAALSFLARGWQYMIQRQQERAWQVCKNRLTRLRFIPDEDGQRATFDRIMALDNEPDVRSAAAVHPGMYQDYQSEAEEPIYEQVGGWLGLYMECVKHNQIPLAFHFWTGVLVLSAACRRNVYIELGGSRIWMNQFIFLVGPRGSGKSEAMAYGRDLLVRMNEQLWDYDGRGKREERYEWQVNLMPEDSSQEHIINGLEAIGQRKVRDADLNETSEPVDATALLLIDEMSVHYGEDNWAVGKKTPFYVSIFGRDYYDKGTVKRGKQSIKNLCFSMAGCSAPEWMRDVITPHVLKGGFVDRTLYIYRKFTHRSYSQLDRPIIDPLMMQDLAASLTYWTKPPLGMKRPAQFTSAAKDWIRARYKADRARELEALDAGRLMEERASLVRSSNQVLKLATVLSMSDGMFPRVDVDHLKTAINVLDIEETHFSDFLGEVRRNKHADVLDRIKDYFRQSDWEVSRTQLMQRFKNTIGLKRVMQTYIDTLLEDGSIGKETRGRELWYVWIGDK